MARKLPIEYPGAMYYVMNRGDHRDDTPPLYSAKRPSVPSPINIGQNPPFKASRPPFLGRFKNAKIPANTCSRRLSELPWDAWAPKIPIRRGGEYHLVQGSRHGLDSGL